MTHADTMDRIYRLQRHFYDATRKLLLPGRDALLGAMDIAEGDRVIEVGCGTARNLIRLAKQHPGARFFGLDASEEMLATARKKLARAGLGGRVRLVQGYAEALDRRKMFDLDTGVDKVFFSYSLSMIPAWQDALLAAFASLKPSGALFVDFWDQARWPRPLRRALVQWLSLFHVRYVPGLLEELQRQYRARHQEISVESILSGYAFLATPASGHPAE